MGAESGHPFIPLTGRKDGGRHPFRVEESRSSGLGAALWVAHSAVAEEHDQEQEEKQQTAAVVFVPETAVAEQHDQQQEKEQQAATVVPDSEVVEESAKDTGHRKTSFM
jgi:hypothetical protein